MKFKNPTKISAYDDSIRIEFEKDFSLTLYGLKKTLRYVIEETPVGNLTQRMKIELEHSSVAIEFENRKIEPAHISIYLNRALNWDPDPVIPKQYP